MHIYKTHNCNQLNDTDEGKLIKLSGWIDNKRNHKNLIFIDLRDNYGMIQIVVDNSIITSDNLNISQIAYIPQESVITVIGTVVLRKNENINNNLNTGTIEIFAKQINIESYSEVLPFAINSNQEINENLRLKYRFLDLRRKTIRNNILLRSEIIKELRNLMYDSGFTEFQTPILTSSSPEGARDFLVPSRLHKGKFYALPQAPQQFKQLLMVAGFDKYFQIAPCFRDEDARADRSPGEFYQLDIEMSYVTQDDIIRTVEPILYQLFKKFAYNKKISEIPFPRITYEESLSEYNTDKPDLRNPIRVVDVTEFSKKSNLKVIETIKAIILPNSAQRSKAYITKIINIVKQQGVENIHYIAYINKEEIYGSLLKLLTNDQLTKLIQKLNVQYTDLLFLINDKNDIVSKLTQQLKHLLGVELDLIEKDCFKFCWITDFPFYSIEEDTKKIIFNHNPFSMPQGGLTSLNNANSQEEILKIKAFQYDIVCNGIELSSGAIRNHKLEILYKAFEIAGYSKLEVNRKFNALVKALNFGAPPHGGLAPGIDRIIMLLAGVDNIREITPFPLTQKAEDVLLNAPCEIDEKLLKELNLSIINKKR